MGIYLGVGACLGYYDTSEQVYANYILALTMRLRWCTLFHISPTLTALLFLLYLSCFAHAHYVQSPIQQYTYEGTLTQESPVRMSSFSFIITITLEGFTDP